MKRFFTFSVMLMLAVSSVLAWQTSDTQATRLDLEGSKGQVQMKTLRTDDGKIVLSWLRGERTDGVFSYKLHLQLFDVNGEAMFGDEGVIVCDKRTRTYTTDYGMALAPNGDNLLAYTDIRNDPNGKIAETYLYRYNQQGEPVWGVDGILFPSGKIHETAFGVEDIAPAICVSGNNIFAAAYHSEYYKEKANEDNWQPSPFFPDQEMPDSVQVSSSAWNVVLLNDDGTIASEEPMKLDTKMLTMNPAPEGNVYAVYDNEAQGLDAQLLNAELKNVWEAPVTIEERSLSGESVSKEGFLLF